MIEGKIEYQVLEHTADTGFLVRAESLALLHEKAASALFDLMVDLNLVRVGEVEHQIEVDAPDRETLLVAWLGEILSLSAATECLFCAFSVDEISNGRLVGRVRGEEVDLDRHEFKTEIKAVTYHHLLVSEDRDGWSARVLVDI